MTAFNNKISSLRQEIESGKLEQAHKLISSLENKIEKENLEDQASFFNQKAFLSFRTGNFDEAESYFTKAITLFKDAEIEDLEGVSFAFNGLGLTYYRKGNANQAFQFLRKSLELRLQIGDHQQLASSLNNVATILIEAGASDRALDYLAEALDVLENDKAGEDNSSLLSTVYTSIGNVHERDQNFSDALEYYEKAYEEIQKSWEPWTASIIMYNLANIYIDLGKLSESQEYINQAIEIQERMGEKINPVALGKSLFVLARLHIHKNDLSLANITADRAVTYLQKKVDNTLGDCYNLLAWIAWKSGELQEAYDSFMQALKVSEELGNSIDQLEVLSLLSGLQSDMNKFLEAEESLKTAQNLLDDPEADERLLILLYAGYLAFKKDEYTRAEKYFHQVEMEAANEDCFNIQIRSLIFQAQTNLQSFYDTNERKFYDQMTSTLRTLEMIPNWSSYPSAYYLYQVIQATIVLISAEFEEANDQLMKIIEETTAKHYDSPRTQAGLILDHVTRVKNYMMSESYTDFIEKEVHLLDDLLRELEQCLEPQPRAIPQSSELNL